MPSSRTRSAREQRAAPPAGRRRPCAAARRSAGGSPATRAAAPCRPLRGSCRPTKTIRCSRPPGSARSAGSGRRSGSISYSPGSQRSPVSRACSETAIRWSIRSTRNPHTGLPSCSQPSSPDAWNVATIGQSRERERRDADRGRHRLVQVQDVEALALEHALDRAAIVRGLRTMFGSAPFAGTITERPTGITSGGGSPCRPSRGCSTRVKLPGGSLPHDRARLVPEPPERVGLELGVLDARRPRTTRSTGRRFRPSRGNHAASLTLRAVAEPTSPSPMRRESLWRGRLPRLGLLAIVIVLGVRACDDDGIEQHRDAVMTDPARCRRQPSLTSRVPRPTPGGRRAAIRRRCRRAGGRNAVAVTRDLSAPSQAA